MLKNNAGDDELAGLIPTLRVQEPSMKIAGSSFARRRNSAAAAGQSPDGRASVRDLSRLSARSIPRLRDTSVSIARSEFTVSSSDDESDFSIDGDPAAASGSRSFREAHHHQRHRNSRGGRNHSAGARRHNHHQRSSRGVVSTDDDDDDDCDFYLTTPVPAEPAAAPLPAFSRPQVSPAVMGTAGSRTGGRNGTPPGIAAATPSLPPPAGAQSATASPHAAPPLAPASNHTSGPFSPSQGSSSAFSPRPPAALRPASSSARPRPPTGSAASGINLQSSASAPMHAAPLALDGSTELNDDEDPLTIGAATLPQTGEDIGLPPLGPGGPGPPRGSGATAAMHARGRHSADSAGTAVHTVGGVRGDSRASSTSSAHGAPAKTHHPTPPASSVVEQPKPAASATSPKSRARTGTVATSVNKKT
mmetsp:Transcript_49584/g.153093  ORF Transcript_49584/g.153093 Transcript_49584/m.153093 type:complete len:419 (-) Transcript_49584:557-1813(-)|eukprot:CAMPEP_0174841330 /NCGR_PEP_ID=MMETSP1114-20130205/9240_1 /TAXON_ID=312471 /ORGANISM="Neobodo designis, Strain CCAP 1951/1" /LENGTH=418 /DNA_ID=CAMNT_0016075511 /DNA_START=367 /DNA_END=1623 /DNA_ORIENTATION=+